MTKHFFSTVLILMFVAFSSDIKAQNVVDSKEDARVFVQKFYDWYGKIYTKQRHITAQDEIIKRNPQYLTQKLLNALLADHEAWAKHPREIIGLDFDPFTNTLDTRNGYQTGWVTQKGDRFFVDVHDIEKGRSRKDVLASDLILTAEVVKQNGRWVFINFVYPKRYALNNYGGDLVGILDSLHKDRVRQRLE